MKQSGKWLFKIILILTPLLIGTLGLVQTGEDLLDAAFSSFTMYAANYGEDASNWLVEVARWTAPLATAGGVAMLFKPVARAVYARLLMLSGRSVVVYGSHELYDSLRKEGRYPVVEGEDRLLPAARYLLFGEEQENVDFYLKNKKKLENKEVYMQCASLRSQVTAGTHLHLFSPEEIGARLYWKQAGLYQLFLEKGQPEREKDQFLTIAMIGFGRLGEELLIWGLQNNIFSPSQGIRYEIYGDGRDFCAFHTQLDKLEDSIVFQDKPWSACVSSLEKADRILVCQQEQQLPLVQNLLFVLTGKELEVLASAPEDLDMVEDQARLHIFPWKEKALQAENLFDDVTLERAKAINMRYVNLYSDADRQQEENRKNKDLEWARLNAFTRYSNISSADYHEIRLQMLKSWGESPEKEKISPEHFELLSELEHIRWCRFHYLNNWRYGDMVGGKAKNTAARTHFDLQPYQKLSYEEQNKDRDTIGVLLQIP